MLSGLALTFELVTQGPTSRREVALTFDACQARSPAGFDKKIVDILCKKKVKATFFLGGAWAKAHPKESSALGTEPLFEIAQHSYFHPHYTALDKRQALADMSRAQDAVIKTTGRTPRYFRPPYGEFNSDTLQCAKQLGLKVVLWSIVTGDPDKNVKATAIIKTVLTKARPGSIVVMHVNGRGWHTAEALPGLIDGLRAKGYRLVTVSDLLRTKT